MLNANASTLLGHFNQAVNDLHRLAARAEAADDFRSATQAKQAAGVLALRGTELALGKRLSVDMRAVVYQDNLPSWAELISGFSEEEQRVLERILDAMPIPSQVIDVPVESSRSLARR